MWPGLTCSGLLASRGLSPRAGAFYRVVPSPLLSGRERVRPWRGTCLALLFRLRSRTEDHWPSATRTTRTGRCMIGLTSPAARVAAGGSGAARCSMASGRRPSPGPWHRPVDRRERQNRASLFSDGGPPRPRTAHGPGMAIRAEVGRLSLPRFPQGPVGRASVEIGAVSHALFPRSGGGRSFRAGARLRSRCGDRDSRGWSALLRRSPPAHPSGGQPGEEALRDARRRAAGSPRRGAPSMAWWPSVSTSSTARAIELACRR